MTEEETKAPRYMGLQWFVIGVILMVQSIWIITVQFLGILNNIALAIFSVVGICIGAWIVITGTDLMYKYDIRD